VSSESSSKRPNLHAAYQAGLAAYETGRYAEAIGLLAPLAEQTSLLGTLARFYLGQAHMQQGIAELRARRFREAAEHLARARQLNPDSGSLPRYLADCYAGLNRFDMAAREIEGGETGEDGSLPVRLAHALLRDGQLHRAIDTLRAAIQGEPRRAELHYQLGLIHASVDDWATARDSLISAARLDPKDAQIARHLGLAYAATNDSVAAVVCLQTAQGLAPHDANIAWLYALAISAAREQGHEIEASVSGPTIHSASDADLCALGEVLIREPDFVESFLALPAAQVDRELFAIIAATLEKALDRHPDYADLHYHCARAYERLGQTDAAIEKANRALGINPRYVQALIALGRLYSSTDRTEDAEERLRQAIEAGGDYPDVHYLLGELLRKRGESAEAATEYRRALQLNSNYSAARTALELVAA
jgi:tetratricopeptide (TPR) repeat protein